MRCVFSAGVVVVRILRRLVLEEQADRLPRDRDVTVRDDFVDDPTGRCPAERSNRIDPEVDVAALVGGGAHAEPFGGGGVVKSGRVDAGTVTRQLGREMPRPLRRVGAEAGELGVEIEGADGRLGGEVVDVDEVFRAGATRSRVRGRRGPWRRGSWWCRGCLRRRGRRRRAVSSSTRRARRGCRPPRRGGRARPCGDRRRRIRPRRRARRSRGRGRCPTPGAEERSAGELADTTSKPSIPQ